MVETSDSDPPVCWSHWRPGTTAGTSLTPTRDTIDLSQCSITPTTLTALSVGSVLPSVSPDTVSGCWSEEREENII